MSLQENRRLRETLVPKGRKDSDSLFSAAKLTGPLALLLVGRGVLANELSCSIALASPP